MSVFSMKCDTSNALRYSKQFKYYINTSAHCSRLNIFKL